MEKTSHILPSDNYLTHKKKKKVRRMWEHLQGREESYMRAALSSAQ